MSYPQAQLQLQGRSTRHVIKTHTYRQIRFNREADEALLWACARLTGKEPGDYVSCTAVCRRAVAVYADFLKNNPATFDAEMRLVREHTKMPKRRKR